jgi:hypothetical protein
MPNYYVNYTVPIQYGGYYREETELFITTSACLLLRDLTVSGLRP